MLFKVKESRRSGEVIFKESDSAGTSRTAYVLKLRILTERISSCKHWESCSSQSRVSGLNLWIASLLPAAAVPANLSHSVTGLRKTSPEGAKVSTSDLNFID